MQRSERLAATYLKSEQWKIFRKGWPDFLCERKRPDGTTEFAFVEVKLKNDKVKPHQKRMHEALRRAGFTVHVMTVADVPVLPNGMESSRLRFHNPNQRRVHERRTRAALNRIGGGQRFTLSDTW